MSEVLRLGPEALRRYAQREDPPPDGWLEQTSEWLRGQARRRWRAAARRMRALPPRVDRAALGLDGLDEAALRARARTVALGLKRDGLTTARVAEAFALVRECAARTIGQRHFDVQLMGGWVMLDGRIAEMQTGEGKTLTATLAAATAALAGWPVHVITVNDYLVRRDAEAMRPVYEALGLSVAAATAEASADERREAYRADVVYVSNKTVVFDYLRDRIALGPRSGELDLQAARVGGTARADLMLRGLHFAIVDEADSVLIDEAVTPLIISAERGDGREGEVASQALALADALLEDEHFRLLHGERRAVLSPTGRQWLIDATRGMAAPWNLAFAREDAVLKALAARHLYRRDEQYLVADGKVSVIDEFTGRVMPDRSWSEGLHQMIEVKEGLEVTRERTTLARISYQSYFRRYRHLAGMTGTAQEVRAELAAVYGLSVVRVPTNRPSRRLQRPSRIFRTEDRKWEAIARQVAQWHAAGIPVLLGTRSVSASEQAARALDALGLPYALLNAKQDRAEAEIVAQAGQRGAVTIATNMAGRGTDIALGPGVAELGGLRVILSERHTAGRIDRQLEGRCARQGDPGETVAMLSLEDPLLLGLRQSLLFDLLRALGPADGSWSQWWWRRWMDLAQRRSERQQAASRRQLLRLDRQLSQTLSFSGSPE